MIRPWQLTLCATALGLVLTAGVFGQSPEVKKLNPYNGKPEAIQQGRTLWLQNGCSGCHGVMGGGGMGLPVIDDVGSGCLYNLSRFGLSDEPVVSESLRSGADVVLFSGDKLLGGPQCGVMVGRADIISKLRSNPLSRALRVDKLTLAALQATLEIHRAGRAFEEIPVLRQLSLPADAIRARAEQLAAQCFA